MPGTGHAPVDDAAFAQRAVLMFADVRDRRHASVIAKHRDALAAKRNDSRSFFGNSLHFTDFDEAVLQRPETHLVDPALLRTREQMQGHRSEEHTSELQSRFGISYA